MLDSGTTRHICTTKMYITPRVGISRPEVCEHHKYFSPPNNKHVRRHKACWGEGNYSKKANVRSTKSTGKTSVTQYASQYRREDEKPTTLYQQHQQTVDAEAAEEFSKLPLGRQMTTAATLEEQRFHTDSMPKERVIKLT